MQLILEEPYITKEYLLERNTQETYLQYYLGLPVKKGLFKSPLREDKNATCSFYKSKSGDIIFKDFSGAFSGNFIDVVKEKYSVNFQKALKIIAVDFGYITSKTIKPNSKPIEVSQAKFESNNSAKIQVEIKPFLQEELDYWMQFGITEETLKKFKVFSCETVFLNDRIFCTSAKYTFGYYRGKDSDGLELWRIYFPKSNRIRFLSNWKSVLLQGVPQLPQTGDLLIVTKSMKDLMCLYELGYTAVAPCSENLFVTESQYKKLKDRFKNIILFYDNDLPGIST